MAVSCSNCGGSHPIWDCRAKSTAARKDVLRAPLIRGSVGSATSQRDKEAAPLPSSPAGTQALPVDTNPVQDAKAMMVNTAAAVATEPAQGVQIPRPGPLPKFDKKAWSREYMAGYMKQYRAEVKAGTRIPKRKGEK